MRVLHILNELLPSGVETMLRAAAGNWSALGIESHILCTGDRVGSYAPALEEAGFTIHHLPFRRSPAFLFAVLTFLSQSPFQTVHIHTERAGFWYAALAFLTGHRRIVRSIHALFLFRGPLRLRRTWQRLAMRLLFGVRMTACSESVSRNERSTFGNPTLVVPNWFNSASYRPAPPEQREAARAALGIAPHQFVLCSLGNCSAVKNHTAILEAVAALRGELDLVYLHAGGEQDGPAEPRQAAILGISNQVRFLGPVVDPCPILHAADLFVMPSLREGFGIAAVEAMGAGLPVALADVDGLRDFHELGNAVHFVAPTPGGFVSAIRRFHAMGPEARRAEGQCLSAAAHARYGAAAGAARYTSLYLAAPETPAAARAVA